MPPHLTQLCDYVRERHPRSLRGIEEARGMAFRCVFVPGVNEGLFPRPPAGDQPRLARTGCSP